MIQMTDEKGHHVPPWGWEGDCSCGRFVQYDHKRKTYVHVARKESRAS